MIFNFELVGLLFVVIWMLVLSILFWRISSHYNTLTKNVSEKNLSSILQTLLKELEVTQDDIKSLIKRCDTIEKEGMFHIQRIGLLRFNPFKDTGGDQSFILALLNGEKTGIVISGLYSRSGTRWYAKKVNKGVGIEHVLSDEEKKAIEQAVSTSKFEK